MMFKYLNLMAEPQVICYDDADDAAAVVAAAEAAEAATAAADATAAAAAVTTPPADGDGTQAFTQEQVNRMMAEDRRKHETKSKQVGDQIKTMETRMQQMIADKRTSDEHKAMLESDLEDVRASQRTAQEQRDHIAAKATADHESALTSLTDEKSMWEDLYKTSMIDRAIIDAAIEHDAFNPDQIIDKLKPRTEMRPHKDEEGNLTGSMEARVASKVIEEDGTVLTSWDTPSQVVEKLKTSGQDKDGNLFRSAVIAGIGGGTAASTTGSGIKINPNSISPEEYAKRFKENPESLGLPPRKNY